MKIHKLAQRSFLVVAVGFCALQSGASNAAAVVANCNPANFVEGTANNKITAQSASYTPKCLRVRAGAVVTIDASAHHPLSALADVDSVPNPFAANTPFTSAQTRTLTKPGIYGYYCEVHGDRDGDGMAGAILVE